MRSRCRFLPVKRLLPGLLLIGSCAAPQSAPQRTSSARDTHNFDTHSGARLTDAEQQVRAHLLSAAAALNGPLPEPAAGAPTSAATAQEGPEARLRNAAGALRAAAVVSCGPSGTGRAAFLRAAAEVLTGDRSDSELDPLWIALGDVATVPVLAAASLPAESNTAARFTLDIGAVVAGDQRWVRAFLGRLAEFERTLPLPAGYVPRGPYPDRILIADLLVRGGANPTGRPSQTRLPADAARRKELGSHWVFWRNNMRERWFADSIAPAASALLDSEQRPLATADAHLRFYATRFATYQLGPQTVRTATGPHSFEEYFGTWWGPLSIVKADLLGVLAHEWLIGDKLEPAAASTENLVMLVVMNFVALADAENGAAPPTHRAASNLVLQRLRSRGALTFDDARQTWHVDVDRTRAAARELVAEVLEIHGSGDRERAAALFAQTTAPDPQIMAALERMGGRKLKPRRVRRART